MPAGHHSPLALLIDADDTLWENNIYYLRCTTRFQALLGSFGCTPEAAVDMLNAVERERIPRHGYGPLSYMGSLGVACRRSLAHLGLSADAETVAAAEACASLVLSPPMVLLPDVGETLSRLRTRAELVLVTKGDETAQQGKVRRSGLADLFDHLYIVPEKSAAVYRSIVSERALDPENTWMVGNSPRSDINPALEAGIGAVHIPHSNTWSFEQQEIADPNRVVVLSDFGKLVALFSDWRVAGGKDDL